MYFPSFWSGFLEVFRDASIRRLKPSPRKASTANSFQHLFPERGWKLEPRAAVADESKQEIEIINLLKCFWG
jgi:hypothetical protein